MTEEQIEQAVERKVDALDARFMRTGSTMTQEEYNEEQKAITRFAEHAYRVRRRG